MTDNVVPMRAPAPEIRVRKMLYDEFGRVVIDKPAPPGLLLSLGDGSAVEGTALMLARVLRKITFPPGMRTVEDLAEGLAPRIISALIQQAQEARDV